MASLNRGSAVNLFWAVVISTSVAFVLMLIALPQSVFYFRPDWVALVVIFWALYQPERFGPVSGFIIGTLLEVLLVKNLGVFGFGLACLAFIVNSTHRQLKVLSPWQQVIIIGLFIGFYKVITGWLTGLVSDFQINAEYWYSLLGDVLIWPFVTILLNELRRFFRLS